MKNNNQYHKKTWLQRVISILIIIAIIYGGIYLSKYLMRTKKKIHRKKIHKMVAYVETVNGKIVDTNYIIYSFGNIVPAKKVTIYPEVNGKIIYINKNFLEGKFLKKGELIAEIDKRDYIIDLKKKIAQLNSLYEDLKIEIGKQKAAQNELNTAKKIIKNIDNKSLYLILRKPYIKKIKEKIKITKADIQLAKIRLERTEIKSPFNAFVLKKYIDIGSYVSPGVKIGDLIYSDEFFVNALFPVSDLNWLDLNKTNRVKLIFDNSCILYGTVKSIERAVDEKGLMAKAIISIKPESQRLSPLLINNFVNIEIYGKPLKHIVKFPRNALRENSKVWLFKNGKLKIKKIKVIFKNKNYAFTYDLTNKDKIITSHIAIPVENMPLKETGINSEKNN